ncbi:MAG: primosomal protein N' [Thermoguttaceae bacterium]|jgi:primosomal protein N' (replication factor Y)
MSDQQRNLFDTEPDPWDADDQAEQLVAGIVFATGPAQEFDYRVPDTLRGMVEPGRRVLVPLGKGNRQVQGYCVRVESRPTGRRLLKPLAEVVDRRSLLSPAMLRLTHWIADYYLSAWGQVLETVLPAGVRGQAGTRMATLLTLDPCGAERLATGDMPDKYCDILRALAAAAEPLTPQELAIAANCSPARISRLRRKGLIRSQTVRVSSARQAEVALPREAHLRLNPDQQKALDTVLAALRSQQHRTLLIHGVTGSGKTEVYIQAIEEVVRYGRQAIVLVPEISLTPQTVERFRRRFGGVAVLHSHMSDADRYWHWQRIADGRVSVVVGARSAIFAPTPQLGLIVLDEEHESTFKQETAPRYHAREVAVARASAENVPLILGSATPSLESWSRARLGQYQLIEMPRRVLNRRLPEVGTIDLRADGQRTGSRGSISRLLHQAIQAALQDDGQVILLLNRRGYSTHIQCPTCGEVVRCPDCDIALTHHKTGDQVLCHLCDYRTAPPTTCPACDSGEIRYWGMGTQKLEAEVRARFPNAPLLRMDTDTMRARGAHEKALTEFREGKARILLGTQMIAKGLDFPNVTLVGVIQADTALHLPDFRAAERTFHLVTQVAGRTGRGDKGGRVLVQTYSPDHPAIRAAVQHDYAAFAAQELPLRKLLHYPPFAAMIRLVIRGESEAVTKEFALWLGRSVFTALEARQAQARVLGPAPAPTPRIRGKYRFQIQIQGPDGDKLRAAVREVENHVSAPADVEWIADVDPLNML